MADRDKVIKGLECCSCKIDAECNECPYNANGNLDVCGTLLADDALELLKEQEGKWIEYPECLKYDGAYSDDYIVCSACKHVFNIIDNCTEEFDYCPHCGAKMDS